MDAQMPGLIRTAFTLPDKARWTGGYQYFVNLFRVLHRHGAGKVRPVIYVGDDVDAAALAPVEGAGAEVIRSGDFSAAKTRARLADALLTGIDHRAARLYREHGIRVVFESARYHGWRFPLPAIAWLPDFQHRLLPGIFSRRAWWQRDLGFRAQIASARTVMLSSEASRAECEKFYPSSRGRTRVVPFAAELPPEANSGAVEDVRKKYDLPQDYFYLPNQFWAHKNHRVIIEALQVLRQRGVDATVAATGALADYRRPGLLRELEDRAAELGLEARFRFLGLVPRVDVYALMRGAVAIVNPSLSEGWSTAVEEARALGVPMALSDIPVHREQAAHAAFFDPRSAAAAADALQRLHAAEPALRDAAALARRTRDNEDYLVRYATNLEALVEAVAEP